MFPHEYGSAKPRKATGFGATRPTVERPQLGPKGCLGIVFGIPLAFVVAVVGIGLYQMYERNTPPDVRATAQSAAVLQLDAAATNAVSAEFDRLLSRSSRLTAGPSAVSDYCWSQGPDEFGGSWTQVTCVREVTHFYAFDGALSQRHASLVADFSGSPVEQNLGPAANDQTLYLSSAGPDGLNLNVSGRLANGATAVESVANQPYGVVLADGQAQFIRQSEPLNGKAAAESMLSSHDDLLVLTIVCRYYPTAAGY